MLMMLPLSLGAMELGGVVWTRPLGFLALLLPLLLVLWARRPQAPAEQATGALAHWQALAHKDSVPSRGVRRGVAGSLWWLLASLVLAALALAGPRLARASAAADWKLLIDRSPSMYLALGPDAEGLRIEEALLRAEAWLDELGVGPERRLWSEGQGGFERGALPPSDWLRPPSRPRGAPRWERFDAPGWLWISDRGDFPRALNASYLSSGGAAIPGPIGGGFTWDGTQITRQPVEGPAHQLGWVALGNLPEELEQFVGLWCEERGLGFGAGQGPKLLSVEAQGEAGADSAWAGRDGWRLLGAWHPGGAPSSDPLGPLEPWLAPGLVSWGPGRVVLALGSVQEISGDPAEFALSWSRLLDGALLEVPGTVSLPGRRGAGSGGHHLGSEPALGHVAAAGGEVPEESALEAWLLLAALCLAGAWGVLAGSR